MKIISSYKVQIKQPNHLFDDTVRIYRDAVNFLISVCLNHWSEISALNGMLLQKSYVESIRQRNIRIHCMISTCNFISFHLI